MSRLLSKMIQTLILQISWLFEINTNLGVGSHISKQGEVQWELKIYHFRPPLL